jgi:hypothetical protein
MGAPVPVPSYWLPKCGRGTFPRQVSHLTPVRICTGHLACRWRSAPWHGPHRVDPDDDRRSRVERQLAADLAATQQFAQERSLARRQTDVDRLALESDLGHVIIGAGDAESTSKFVHGHVRAALDEPTQLRGRAAVRRWRRQPIGWTLGVAGWISGWRLGGWRLGGRWRGLDVSCCGRARWPVSRPRLAGLRGDALAGEDHRPRRPVVERAWVARPSGTHVRCVGGADRPCVRCSLARRRGPARGRALARRPRCLGSMPGVVRSAMVTPAHGPVRSGRRARELRSATLGRREGVGISARRWAGGPCGQPLVCRG